MAAGRWQCDDADLAAGGNGLAGVDEYIGDEVFTKGNYSLIKWIAFAIGVSTLIQAADGFCVVPDPRRCGTAGDHRDAKNRAAAIERLPMSYFDSTQSGQLISRIMNDAGRHS